MKKTLIAALLLAAVMLLGGCKGKENNGNGASSNPMSGPESKVESGISSMLPESSEPQANSLPESSGSAESGPASQADNLPANAVSIDADSLAQTDFSAFSNDTVTWGPGHAMDDQNRPTACVQLQEKYGGDGALFIQADTDEKAMCLTFDEGYENGYTPAILDVLKEKDCPAVFFVTMPYVKSNPELIQRMIDEGHVVGNHSTHHPSEGMQSLSPEDMIADLAELHNYMVENFNYQMTYFRPPAGLFSERSLEIAKSLGYTSVLWSFGYYDYNPAEQPDPAAALEKVTAMAHPGGIPLLHAVSKTNPEILGQAIDNWRDAGYTLAKLQ